MLRIMRDFRATDGTIIKRDTLVNEIRRQIEVATHRTIIVTVTADGGHRLIFTVRDLENGLLQEERRS